MSCCTPCSPHRTTVIEILSVHRVIFEAAVESFIPAPVTSFEYLFDFKEGPCRRVHWAPRDTPRSALPANTDPAVVAAFRKWNLCDHFCFLFYEHLKEILAREGAQISWVIYRPEPEIFFADAKHNPWDIFHSALRVRLQCGETLMFDCTGEQFGWPSSEWLTCSRCHPEFKMPTQGNRVEWKNHRGGFGGMERAIEEGDDGYWARVLGGFRGLWRKVDWQKFKREPLDSKKNIFRAEARRLAEEAAREAWGP